MMARRHHAAREVQRADLTVRGSASEAGLGPCRGRGHGPRLVLAMRVRRSPVQHYHLALQSCRGHCERRRGRAQCLRWRARPCMDDLQDSDAWQRGNSDTAHMQG